MPHRRRLVPISAAVAFAAALAASPAAAQAPLTEADARELTARQARALQAGDLDAYFATFAAAAVFTQQALGSDNNIVPYGSSTLAEARRNLARTVARSKVAETAEVRRVVISGSGRGGALHARVRTRITTAGRTRDSCAERLMTFARIGGRVRALAQTDTLVRCRRPA